MVASKIRTFRIATELDSEIKAKAQKLGYLTPSEYLRAIIRKELDKEEPTNE